MNKKPTYLKVGAFGDKDSSESTPLFGGSGRLGWGAMTAIGLAVVVGVVALIVGGIALGQNNDGFFPAGKNLVVGNLKSTGIVDFSGITTYIQPGGMDPSFAPLQTKRTDHQGRTTLIYNVQPGDQNIILGNPTVTYDIRFPAKMGAYVQKSYVIFSNTTNAHTVRFTGLLAGNCDTYQQTTFDGDRAFPVAKFQPRAGAAIEFTVVDCGTVFRRGSRYVDYCTPDVSYCSHPEENLNATWLYSQMTKVDGLLDTSLAKVKPAPEFIVVGQAQPGVVSWPVSLNKRVMEVHERAVKHVNSNMHLRSEKTRDLHARTNRLAQIIPIYPSFINTIALPPADAVHVATIQEAMRLLQGKVITNTTIYLHAGTYNENVVLDGFVSNCDASGSQAIEENQGTNQCRGLNFVGDARILAGKTMVNGHYPDLNTPENILFGGDGSRVAITCINSTSINVDRPVNLGWVPLYPFTPDYAQLGLVAGDKIIISDGVNRNFKQEKTVTAVSGSIINFLEPGCTANGLGAAVTFLPNRVIVGQAPDLTAAAPTPLEQFSTVPAALNTQVQANVVGLYVRIKTPSGAFPVNIDATCLISGGSVLSNVVCNGLNAASPDAMVISGSRDGIFSSPNFNQDAQLSHNFTESDVVARRGGFTNSITAINGNMLIIHGFMQIREIAVLGGTYFPLQLSRVNARSIVAVSTGSCAFTNEGSQTIVGTFMCLSKNTRGLRARWNGQITVSEGVAKIEANSTTQPCISVVDNSRVEIIDPFAPGEIQTFLGADALQFIGCPASQYVVQHTGVLHITDVPQLVNAASKGQVDETARAIVANNPIAPFIVFSNTGSTAYSGVRIQKNSGFLTGTSAQLLTLSQANRDIMEGRTMHLYSRTAQNHTLTLAAPATWDGVSTVARFAPVVGSGLTYYVVDKDNVVVIASKGITFA